MSQDLDPMFSRSTATAARPEKLTVIAPLTIRQTESMARDIEGLADLHGMERSELIRYLVSEEIKRQKGIWEARNALFASRSRETTGAASDGA